MTEHHRPEFGEAVKQVLQQHGLSLRSQRIRTGIDHMTMKGMCDGIPPRLEKVEQFAKSFKLNVGAWRVLAGYDPVEPSPDDAAEALLEAADRGELDDLDTEGIDVDVEGYSGPGSMTDNDRRRINAVLKKLIAADRKRKGLD